MSSSPFAVRSMRSTQTRKAPNSHSTDPKVVHAGDAKKERPLAGGRSRKGVRSRRGAAGRSEIDSAVVERLLKVEVNRVVGQVRRLEDLVGLDIRVVGPVVLDLVLAL